MCAIYVLRWLHRFSDHGRAMPYNPDIHHRRSIRLTGYDYSLMGAYFVTVCTHNREMLLEDPVLKQITEQTWFDLPKRFGVSLDEFIIMPNHVHFIIWITAVGAPLAGDRGAGANPVPTPVTLAAVIGAFKSIVATDWLNWIKSNAPDRSARIWQRNYYERVIKEEEELCRARQYIRDNPTKWADDPNNPDNVRTTAMT
jgi:REP element-mobilizing transposase RayT